MRPIRLKISAFGPFIKPVELNFNDGLKGEKIFLIHGVTGAGKTSILDAICYALYDKSSGGEREVDNLRAEQAKPSDKTEVEFEFALGEKIIKIRRNPRYSLPKGTADIKKSVEIYENNKLKIFDNKEAETYIKNLLGFNVEQFRQVVLLPQGKFRDFLMADSSKRSEILNVIFNATLYAEIEKILKEKAKNFQGIFENLGTAQKNLLTEAAEIISAEKLEEKNLPEKISELEKDLNQSKIDVEKIKNQLDEAQEKWTAERDLSKDFERYEVLEKDLKATQAEFEKILSESAQAKVEFELRKDEEDERKKIENKIDELKKNQKDFIELQKKISELKQAEESEKNAKSEIEKLERVIKKCHEELDKIKIQAEKLQGADVTAKELEQNLKNSQTRQARLNELLRLKKIYQNSQKNLALAEKNRDDAQKKLDRLNWMIKNSAAIKLAENLQEGDPCPVCGALSHPKLAIAEGIIPSEEEILIAEKELKRLEIERETTINSVTATGEKIKFQEEEIKKLGEVPEVEEAEKLFTVAKKLADELKICRERLPKGEEVTKQKILEREEFLKIFETKSKNAEKLRGIIAEKKDQISAEYLSDSAQLEADLKFFQKKYDAMLQAWKLAEEKFHRLEKILSAQEVKVKSEQSAKVELEQKISGKEKPDLAKLNDSIKIFSENYSKAVADHAKLEERFKRLKNIFEKLCELKEKLLLAEKNKEIFVRLSSVAEGKNLSKISFQRYYLNGMFQDIVRESNDRLEKMSGGRYHFHEMETVKKRKRSAGLDLEIFDAYTGKARPVETLSGGESFLASLSLALGLANVVKNISGGVNLDTIFIDEGFGTLDGETLDVAINTLEDLQSGGRLVGIISHVDELKKRIPARLEVTKTGSGSFAKFI